MRLESGLFEEVEHDLAATPQALTVVVIVSIASGVAGVIGSVLGGHPGQAVSQLVFGIVGGIVSWVVWSLIAYFIGTRVFSGTATPGELLRTLGFAYSPSVLQFFSFIPVLGGLISIVAAIWTLIAGVIAVRQALDFDTGKAIATVILGWLAVLFISVVLSIVGLGFLRS